MAVFLPQSIEKGDNIDDIKYYSIELNGKYIFKRWVYYLFILKINFSDNVENWLINLE